MEYEIKVIEREAYEELDVQYETEDGKVYTSEYSVPAGVKRKKVSYKTGKTLYTEKEVFYQKVGKLDLNDVIKAINNI